MGAIGVVCVMVAAAYLPASVHYSITETYQFKVPIETDITLIVLFPQDGPYQTITRSDPLWSGTFAVQKTESVDIITLRGTLSPGTHEATVTYSAKILQGRARWDGEVEPEHLAPHPRIESDHPDIIAKAFEIGGGTTRGDAYDIFNFVAGSLTHPAGDRINVCFTALDALQSGEGVCEDYSQLLVALFRARGIPARMVSGLALPDLLTLPYGPSKTQQWNHPAVAHAWVEVFTGQQWEMAEPTWVTSELLGRYYFGRSSGQHLSYGDDILRAALYEQIWDQVAEEGHIVGAMSAPLKFVAGATTEGVFVIPAITMAKGWDGRWAKGLLVLVLFLMAGSVLDKLKKNRDA